MTATDTAADDVLDLVADLERWDELHPYPGGLGPSGVGSCRRALVYDLTGTEPDPDYDDDRSAMLAGTLLHHAIAYLREQLHGPAGALVEAKVEVPGLERPGTTDAYQAGVVDDVKTMGCHVYDAQVAIGQPRDYDVDQVAVYALGLEDAGHQVTTLQITYYNRCSGEVWRCRVPYDREHAMRALLRLHAVLDAAEEGRLLDRDHAHPNTTECKRCPFRARCWQLGGDLATELGPLTMAPELLAGGKPDELPEEVAAVARELLAAKAEAAAAKDRADALREELRGWGGCLFTDDEGQLRKVGWTKPGKPKQEVDQEELLLRAQLAGVDVPMRDKPPAAQQLRVPVVKAAG